LDKRLDLRSQATQGTTTWLIKDIAKKGTTLLVDFAARFRRNIIFRPPENTKIAEKKVLKTQWIQSPEKCDLL